MGTSPHTINWFEIPAKDIARAQKFYETVLGVTLQTMEMDGCKMAMFPGGDGSTSEFTVHGAICQYDGFEPSTQGTMIYFNGGDDLNTCLSRVTAAGGTVEKEKFSIGEHGFCATFRDTEGNRLSFHSNN